MDLLRCVASFSVVECSWDVSSWWEGELGGMAWRALLRWGLVTMQEDGGRVGLLERCHRRLGSMRRWVAVQRSTARVRRESWNDGQLMSWRSSSG